MVAVLAPRIRRLEQFTLPDILELRYNKWAKLLGSLTMMVLTVGGLVVLSPTAATAPRPPRTR